MTKAELVKRIKTDEPSCLTNAHNDEPVFVLRAQDVHAPAVVRYWAELAKKTGSPEGKYESAIAEAVSMEEWQGKNGSKTPD